MENLWLSTVSESDLREYECKTNHGVIYIRLSRSCSGIEHAEIGTRENRAYAFTLTRVTGEEDTRWVNPRLSWLLREHRPELSLFPDDEILKLIDLPKLMREIE
ncbi:hypothetical protein HYV88_01415 [Candidatus Woesearchaeota archaeon]|nr:hypothetical protein [Candidatus Woesearchaeota archaeon]